MNALIMVFQFGINMIVPIFLCTLAGVWIGKKTGADWVTVPLFFLGAFAGANNIYRMVQKFLKPEDDGRAVRQTPGRQSTTETEISDSISRVEKDVKKNKCRIAGTCIWDSFLRDCCAAYWGMVCHRQNFIFYRLMVWDSDSCWYSCQYRHSHI